MADWRDGAEYAPIERPEGFATPRVAELSRPEPRVDLAANQPPVAPDAFAPNPTPVPPLEALVPQGKPTRDPRVAFDSASAAVVSGSAWGAAHAQPGQAMAPAWDPKQPLNPSHGPGAALDPSQFAPPTGAPVAPAVVAPPPGSFPAPLGVPGTPGVPNQGGFNGFVQRVGLPLLIVLVVGFLVRPLSLVMLLSAVALASRGKVARETLIRVHGIAAVSAILLGFLVKGNADLLDALNRWSAVACLVCVVAAWLVTRPSPGRR